LAGPPDRSPVVSTHTGRILIAEDDGYFRAVLEERLIEAGHEVVAVADGARAWDLVTEEHFDVVLADWMMPMMDGFELCRRVKAAPRLGSVYCVLLTTKDRVPRAAAALGDGADDFVVKPGDELTLLARVRTGVLVSGLHRRLDEEARRDSLTGTYHAGSLDDRLIEEIERARRYHLPLSLVLVDLDGLAEIGDNFGRATRDETLAGAGNRIMARIRTSEFAIRTPRDELAVVLPSTELKGAGVLARDLEAVIGQLSLPRSDVFPYRVSASTGCVQLTEESGATELLERARTSLAQRRIEIRREQLRLMAH